jgi:hypothetical protein
VSNLGEHDGDGIRYAMHLSAPKGGSAQMLRDPAGGWVSWEDYARLKAEVERLTKAGDEMAADLIGEFGSYNSVYAWNAAKNGGKS